MDIFGRTICPPPLPPTRKIEMIRTEVNFPSPCCCCKNTGKLTCSRCKAIKYCSSECQMNGSLINGSAGWKEHKGICNKIRKHIEETKDAIEELSMKFGGMDNLLGSPLVKQGRFRYQSIAGELMGEPPLNAKNPEEKYILARMRLIEAYVKCGEEALNCTAFRLAEENMMDLLCLCYSNRDGEHVRYTYCGWMVAAGKDQQALNYLCYFRYRILSPHPLPYLDLSKDEDVEGESYLKLIKEKQSKFDAFADMWFHDYMLIALIKYKRLQSLIVQRRKNLGSWNSFLMGTHPRAGKASKILKIRGNRRIMKKLEEYVVEEPVISRITFLSNQIKEILSAVNERNPLIIPGLIDRNSIPEEPSFEEEDKDDLSDDYEYDEHDGDIHDACWAFGNYGHAWNMSQAYPRVLGFFLRTGNVMPGPWKNEYFLVEGLLQAAFDVDPTRFYGRGDDLGIEGMVPRWAFNMELMDGNGGEVKEEGNVATASENKEETKNDTKMYSKMCWYCSKEGVKLYKCMGCRKARYCKDECQEKDWDVHGNYCLLKQQQQRKKIKEGGREDAGE